MEYVIEAVVCLVVGAGGMFAYMKRKQVKAVADAVAAAARTAAK